MTLWHVLVALSVVGGLGGVIYLLCSLPPKQEPPAVRVSPEFLKRSQEEIIFNAIKQGPARIVKADFNRSFK